MHSMKTMPNGSWDAEHRMLQSMLKGCESRDFAMVKWVGNGIDLEKHRSIWLIGFDLDKYLCLITIPKNMNLKIDHISVNKRQFKLGTGGSFFVKVNLVSESQSCAKLSAIRKHPKS